MSRASRRELVQWSRAIVEEYEAMRLDLTLRQLYYQLVSRDLIANSQREYKRLGSALTAARYDGTFPLDSLVDRGRSAGATPMGADLSVDRAEADAHDIIHSLDRRLIGADKWHGQPVAVYVWVEKEALSGVFSPTCDELGVGLFACKGYPSVSSLYQWLRAHHQGPASAAHILYFGDHDPDGWQIPRSAMASLAQIAELKGWPFFVSMDRVALVKEQIDRYDPPPFPAKVTSSRCAGYIEEHGTSYAWELDALEPAALQRLIRDRVGQWWSDSSASVTARSVGEARALFRQRFQQIYGFDIEGESR